MKDKQIWEMFSAKLEYESEIKDIYDRNIINYTREGNMQHPSVSSFLIEQGLNPSYPENKKFACCISHDIDQVFLSSSKKQLLKEVLKGNLSGIKKTFKQTLSRRFDPDIDLSKLIEMDKKYQVKSTYYFLAVEKDNPEDYNYSIKEVEPYFERIIAEGNEIGLHGSRRASNNAKNLNVEKNRLLNVRKPIPGYRNHYLKFEIPTTWNLLANEGIKYDTTFGTAHCPGFRNGMCFPFQPYDVTRKKWIDIYEIPLIAMDVSFFNYLKLDYEMAFKLFKSLVSVVKAHQGVFTFLWHNNYMNGEMGEFYERCLKHLADENTWFATGNEIINWWEENKYFDQQQNILNTIEPKL